MNKMLKTKDTMEEVANNRLDKYKEKVTEKPQRRNQLLIKNGEAILVKNGKPFKCQTLEGYLKLPDMQNIEPVRQVDLSIYFTPKKRMIITKNGQAYFRGYEEYNTENSIIFVHATTSYEDLLIADFDDNIPSLIALDDGDVENNVNSLTFKILEYFIKNLSGCFENVDVSTVLCKGEDEDEWE